MTVLSTTGQPLSRAQSEIWMAQMLAPLSTRFNLAQYIEILGPIDPHLFAKSVDQLAEEMEPLRTRFSGIAAAPVQVVGTSATMSAPLIDMSDEPDAADAAKLWMKADLARPVDLRAGPLTNYTLIKIAPDRFFWYMRTHHILVDGFSAMLHAQRMAEIYSSLAEDTVVSPNELAYSGAVLDAETAYRASPAFTADRGYWLQRFERAETGKARHGPTLEVAAYTGRPRSSRRFMRRNSAAGPVAELALRCRPCLPPTCIDEPAPRMLFSGCLYLGRMGASSRRIVGMMSNVLPAPCVSEKRCDDGRATHRPGKRRNSARPPTPTLPGRGSAPLAGVRMVPTDSSSDLPST